MTYPRDPAGPYQDPAYPFRNLDPAPSTGAQTIVQPRPDARGEGASSPLTTEEVIERQRDEFGGLKIGSAFFGWLTATGITAMIAGLLAATGAALGFGVQDAESTARQFGLNADAIGWIGAVVVLVVLFVAYYGGGYVAGRMARFNGVKQGLAVCVCAILMAVVAALVGFALGSRYDLLSYLSAFPRIPIPESALTMAGIIASVVVVVGSLGGAILGGVVGVRYHRRVDRVGLDG